MYRLLLQLTTVARCARHLPRRTLSVISPTLRSGACLAPGTQVRPLCASIKNMAAASDTATPKPSVNITDLVCATCQQGYIDESALQAHKKALGHGKSHRCHSCNKGFKGAYAVYQHLVSPRHGTSPWGIVSFHCDGCGTTYPTYGDLEGHYRAMHQGGG